MIPVIAELVKTAFTSLSKPYIWYDDLKDVRSMETWIKTIWELVTILVSMLTCRLFSTSHSIFATSQHFNAILGDHTTIAPSLVLTLGKHKTKKLGSSGH